MNGSPTLTEWTYVLIGYGGQIEAAKCQRERIIVVQKTDLNWPHSHKLSFTGDGEQTEH